MKKVLFIGLIIMLAFAGSNAFANNDEKATITVQGQVVDESGEPLAGVSIYVAGTGETIYTDLDGQFEIKTPVSGNVNLKVSTISYKETEVKVKPTSSKTPEKLNIQLEKNSIF